MQTISDLVPYFALLALATALFSAPCWRFLDGPSEGRVGSIDGLRGYLALTVVAHHAVVARNWLITGRWELPPDPFYAQIGAMSVGMFFMITSYLFWGKLIASEGRVDWIRLYIGRVFRIAPIYWIAIVLMTCVVFARTGFVLHDPLGFVVHAIARWLALGLFDPWDFNGYVSVWIILAGVFWTLKYEWYFYAALIPASLFAGRRWHGVFAVTFLALTAIMAYKTESLAWRYWTLFAGGMTVASMRVMFPAIRLTRTQASIAVIAILAGTLIAHPANYNIQQTLPLAAAFWLFVSKADLFGLLKSRAASRLGHASYAIYLLQGFAFSVGFDNPALRSWVTLNSAVFWAIALAGAVLLVVVAAFLFFLVERPAIAVGKATAAAVSDRFAKSSRQTIKWVFGHTRRGAG